MAARDFGWAIPIMRAGYAGRALVYVIVAGISLWAVMRGGQAEGTASAFRQLETTTGGGIVLGIVFLGMLAYAIWRLADAIWDLEAYGSDGKGIVARIGMVVTGLIHLAIGILALTMVFGGGGDSQGSTVSRLIGTALGWPGGRWIVGGVGVIIIASAGYYLHKGWTASYRKHLVGNEATHRWNNVLRAGVISQGLVIAVVGGLVVYAGVTADPNEAGGVGKAFDWLSVQPYGQALVIAICVGLLFFALFCAVNARYRIVPRATEGEVGTLAQSLKAKARRATA